MQTMNATVQNFTYKKEHNSKKFTDLLRNSPIIFLIFFKATTGRAV